MSKILICDVLIIGAGPAGSTAARFAAKSGIKVILLEKRKQIGMPVQCAEYVPWQIMQGVKLPEGVIAQRIDSMRTHMPDGGVVQTNTPGFTINRDAFDQHLTGVAVESGAEVLVQTRAIDYEDGIVWASHGKQQLKINARMIIGADGPHSIVGRWMGQSNTVFIHTAQYQMKLRKGLRYTEVYFRRDIPGGYGWVFPKGNVANVGVGVDKRFGITPSLALRKFAAHLHQQGVIEPEVLNVTGGAIPDGGLVERLYLRNMLLVGDAAGMAHPITGAGVSNAVLCGRIAGEIAAQAVLADDLRILAGYEEECRLLLDEPLMRASYKRKAMETKWGDDSDEGLTEALRSSWIAFEEYYQ